MVAKSLIPSKSVFNRSYWISGVSISVILYFGVLWIPRGVAYGGTQGADIGEFEIENYSFEFWTFLVPKSANLNVCEDYLPHPHAHLAHLACAKCKCAKFRTSAPMHLCRTHFFYKWLQQFPWFHEFHIWHVCKCKKFRSFCNLRVCKISHIFHVCDCAKFCTFALLNFFFKVWVAKVRLKSILKLACNDFMRSARFWAFVWYLLRW